MASTENFECAGAENVPPNRGDKPGAPAKCGDSTLKEYSVNSRRRAHASEISCHVGSESSGSGGLRGAETKDDIPDAAGEPRVGRRKRKPTTYFTPPQTEKRKRAQGAGKKGKGPGRKRTGFKGGDDHSTGSSSSSDDENAAPKPLNADAQCLELDKSVTWDSIGGLSNHVNSLKEMILLPLLYPEVFSKYNVNPPRGVLFYGPPGCGKTLVARALANSCSQAGRKVSFFMRKGADCLSKWVGEAERQLRLLFEEAQRLQPSIIFFDEIDGLAPVRSSRQDQIHSSIVSTLLALMDGVTARGEVVVIGATNRIDHIDSALRRPGRFDREFAFSLPSKEARREILSIHTASWITPLSDADMDFVSDMTYGYCGADLASLCTESMLLALRRTYPQIYSSEVKLQIDANQVRVQSQDLIAAMKKIIPASHRASSYHRRPLAPEVKPLLCDQVDSILTAVRDVFPGWDATGKPPCSNAGSPDPQECTLQVNVAKNVHCSFLGPAIDEINTHHLLYGKPLGRQRILVHGPPGSGQSLVGSAVLHALEHISVHCIDTTALLTNTSTKTLDEAVVMAVSEAKRAAPSILYLPHIDSFWATANDHLRVLVRNIVEDIPPSIPILLIGISDVEEEKLPGDLRGLFARGICSALRVPSSRQVQNYLRRTLSACVATSTFIPVEAPEPLAPAVSKEPEQKDGVTKEVTLRLVKEFQRYSRRLVDRLLSDNKYRAFWAPVSAEDVPDYYEIITNPMDLSRVATKINEQSYGSIDSFLADIRLIRTNAKEYNPPTSRAAVTLINRAYELEDFVSSCFEQQNPDYLKAVDDALATVHGSKTAAVENNEQEKGTNDNSKSRPSTPVAVVNAEPSSPISCAPSSPMSGVGNACNGSNPEDPKVTGSVRVNVARLEVLWKRMCSILGGRLAGDIMDWNSRLENLIWTHKHEENKAALLQSIEALVLGAANQQVTQ